MKLLEVLNNIDFETVAGDLNKEITSVEYDSRKVAIGSLFVCVKGFTVDGHSYASMAAEKGASAIVVDKNRTCLTTDELDALVLSRTSGNDLREMARVTSTFLRELDALSDQIVVIATTNLFEKFDKALVRRFDAIISFDRYTRTDLIEVADAMLTQNLKKAVHSSKDLRLFNKILNQLSEIPYPGDLKQVIKTAIAFSDEGNKYDYLRKIYLALNDNPKTIDIQDLSKKGFTTREIEILSRIPKSSVSRKLNEVIINE